MWWNSLRNSFKEVFLLERIRKDRKNSLEQFFVGVILGLWLLWTDSKVDIGILFIQFDDIRNPLFVASILIGFFLVWSISLGRKEAKLLWMDRL